MLRCAPEQVRPATSEERALIATPQVELLGIKDMIEGGTFKSQQFIDLVSQSYPTVAPPRSFERDLPSNTAGSNQAQSDVAMDETNPPEHPPDQ